MAFPKAFYRWRPHPWHGLDVGIDPPAVVLAYIELTPFDSVKYEVDKATGYLKVDRPHRTSSQPPALYGFIPRTFCGERVNKLSPLSTCGDADPLDICVLSERPIQKSDIVLNARVVGGIQMVDHGEADDKIIAVLLDDNVWGDAREIGDIPAALLERLRHYFSTYKMEPGTDLDINVDVVYGYEHACKVIEAAVKDYSDEFGE